MDTQERISLVYRIIQGKMLCNVLGQDYIIYTPNLDILIDSQNLYNKIIEEYKFNNWLRQEDCERVLTYNGLWNPDMKDKLDRLNKDVENCKFEIFSRFFKYNERIHYKTQLKSLNEQINHIEDIKHSLDYLTLGGFAHIIQSQFIVCNTIYSKDNKKVFPNFDNANFSLVNLIQSVINENTLFPTHFKDIVRNDPWTSMWRTAKLDVFPQKGVLLSSEQRNLILFSQMFDSIHEHPESPHETILEDDDALDGWMIAQKRKRDADKGDKVAKSFDMENAQEIFLPASSKEEIDRINSFNTIETNAIKAQRKAVIDQVGTIEDVKLPDQQLAIRRLAMEKIKSGIR